MMATPQKDESSPSKPLPSDQEDPLSPEIQKQHQALLEEVKEAPISRPVAPSSSKQQRVAPLVAAINEQ
jgi:hypothetical protein